MKHDWQAEFNRLEGAYAPHTLASYRCDVELFVTWCELQNVEPFPATAETVTAFIEHSAQTKAASTVKRHMCGLSKILRLMKMADVTKDEEVKLVLRRIRRAKGCRPRQAKGLTQDYLQRFLEAQPDTPVGWRNAAMISLGYDLLTRRSELVALKTEDVSFLENGTLRILITRSKTDQDGEGRLAFSSRRSADLLRRWLEWRGDEIGPLFCPIYQDVAVDRHLSTTTVVRVIKSAAKKADVPEEVVAEFSGHSMRVGAAQDLLCRGQTTAAIMRAGGWVTAHNLARYLQNAEHNVWA